MLTPFRDSFKIPDLRKKILITLVLLAVYRLGCYIPTPGIDGIALAQFFRRIQGTLFGIADLFTGGGFEQSYHFGFRNYALYFCFYYFRTFGGGSSLF